MAVYTSNAIITYHEIDHPAPWGGPHFSDWADYHAAISNLQRDGLLITRHFFREISPPGPEGTHRLNMVFPQGELRWNLSVTWPGSTTANIMYNVDTLTGSFTSGQFGQIREIRHAMMKLIIACHITEWDRTITY